MKVRIAQLLVSKDIESNYGKIVEVLSQSKTGEWVIFPEGMLSGYFPEDPEYLNKLNWNLIEKAIREMRELVITKKVNCLFGTAIFEDGKWYNSTIYLNNSGDKFVYNKVNLATLDRVHFTQGDSLDVYGEEDKFGIQMCRDIVFPEQWKVLKRNGAGIIFHINNAIKAKDVKWKHLLITRAFENQLFVISVNNAEKPQTLPSLVISPIGEIIIETTPQKEEVKTVEIDLSEVKTDFLDQERRGVVEVIYKN